MTVALLLALAVGQIDRPNEDEMFGSPGPPPNTVEQPDGGLIPPAHVPTQEDIFHGSSNPANAAQEAQARSDAGTQSSPSIDELMLTGKALTNRFESEEEKVNPLTIGGTLYLRAQTTFYEHTKFDQMPLTAPGLVDLYLDARPNDRVRGVVVGRLLYDPTQGLNQGNAGISNIGGTTVASPVVANPAAYLDQMYLRFDIDHKIFVTAGRQKIKWGTSRVWNPTDALNNFKRDPLQPFDLRLGVNAVKFHIPVESLGWNFYAYGLLDNSGPANTLGKLGGAARAEIVIPFVKAEVGLDGAWIMSKHPRYGIDISMPLPDPIPIDVYAEVAFRSASDFTVWRVNGDFDPKAALTSDLFIAQHPTGLTAQVSGGLSSTIPYTEKNTITVGLEYFYNPMGVNAPIYPWLIFNNQYTAFYAAQHYAALFVALVGLPNLTWVTVNATTLLNITDLSALVRVDAFFRVLTFLQLEAYVAGNLGTRGGELKFGLDLPGSPLTGGQPVYFPAPGASAGLGLRISI